MAIRPFSASWWLSIWDLTDLSMSSKCNSRGVYLRLGFDSPVKNGPHSPVDEGPRGFAFGWGPHADIIFSQDPKDRDISFRIGYNIRTAVLMIIGQSYFGDVMVKGKMLGRRQRALMQCVDILADDFTLGFRVQIPNHTRWAELYDRNYRKYAELYGVKPDAYLPTPSPSHPRSWIAQGYYVHEKIGEGSFGDVRIVVRENDGNVFAAKRMAVQLRSGQTTPEEIQILRELSHVSEWYSKAS